MVNLVPINLVPSSTSYLFQLLSERRAHESISHRGMPSYKDHIEFVRNHPYKQWFMIFDGPSVVGAIYLTQASEIGVSVFKAHRRKGYARDAINELMKLNTFDEYLANVNPENEKSAKLFESLGFNLCQHTYRREVPQ